MSTTTTWDSETPEKRATFQPEEAEEEEEEEIEEVEEVETPMELEKEEEPTQNKPSRRPKKISQPYEYEENIPYSQKCRVIFVLPVVDLRKL
jgi:hypothetical protein